MILLNPAILTTGGAPPSDVEAVVHELLGLINAYLGFWVKPGKA